MRELPRETRHERGVRGCSAGIESCSRDRCSSQKGSVARKAAGATWAVCAESRLYSFSWKLLFSGETIANIGGNSGPQKDSHPQLVINQNESGQITVAWDDFGTGSDVSPKFDNLMSNIIQAGDSYGLGGSAFIPISASSNGTSTTQGNWGPATIYNAGPSSTIAEDPTSIAVGDVNGDGKNDIVVADDNTASGGIGVLLNTGTAGPGLFPATATVDSANNSPYSVALGDVAPGHSKSSILDAVVANNTSVGGVSVLANGTPPNDGLGVFLGATQDSAGPGTDAVAVGNFDNSGSSIVAANGTANSITIIPDAASGAAPFTLTTGLNDPTAVITGDFNGDGKTDIAVLNSGDDTVKFFLNASTGFGNFTFDQTVPAMSLPAGTVDMTNGGVSNGVSPQSLMVIWSSRAIPPTLCSCCRTSRPSALTSSFQDFLY